MTAPFRNLNNIRNVASLLRIALSSRYPEYFHGHQIEVMNLVQRMHDELGYHKDEILYEVVDDADLPGAAGELSRDGIIRLTETTYQDAMDEKPEGIFTVLHELGHYVLHRNCPLQRMIPNFVPTDELCPEVQADSFALEFMCEYEFMIDIINKDSCLALSKALGLPFGKVLEHKYRLQSNDDLGGRQLEFSFI